MKRLLLCACFGIGILSCREKKKIDVQAPVVDSVSIDGINTTAVTVEAGQTIHVLANLSDNMGLSEVQMDVHKASNGHTHTTGDPGGQDRINVGHWERSETAAANGTSSVQEWELEIPDSIGGTWHIVISLLDDVGLTSSYNVTLNVSNDNLPEVSGTTMPMTDLSGTVHMSAGTELLLSGVCSDPDGISKMYYYMLNSAGTSSDTVFIPIVGDGHSMAFGPASFGSANAGTFRTIVEAVDSLGYHGIWDARIEVSQ